MQFMRLGETNKQVNEYKLKLQKSEQDLAACQNHVSCRLFFLFHTHDITHFVKQVGRLDSQVQRLKQVSENYEKQEDEMRAEKRKIMRDVSI